MPNLIGCRSFPQNPVPNQIVLGGGAAVPHQIIAHEPMPVIMQDPVVIGNSHSPRQVRGRCLMRLGFYFLLGGTAVFILSGSIAIAGDFNNTSPHNKNFSGLFVIGSHNIDAISAAIIVSMILILASAFMMVSGSIMYLSGENAPQEEHED
jgi:hypothetical protein